MKEKIVNPFKLLTRFFVSGLLVVMPLILTFIAIAWIVRMLINQLGPNTPVGGYLKQFGLQISGNYSTAYVIGWLVVILAIVILGFVVDLGARKYVSSTIELLMKRIPLINRLYNISSQIVNMVNTKEREDFKGMTVVYCFFGGEKGAAFLALKPMQQVFLVNDTAYNIIVIPSAPVPVGGSMMLVPESSVMPADISIEDFMKVYISMGAASGDILPCFPEGGGKEKGSMTS